MGMCGMCAGVRRCAQVCLDVRRCVRVCAGEPGCARVYRGVCGYHSWPSPFQKRAGLNKHQGLRQKNRMNAKDTARLCGQILNFYCCFDLFVYISKCKQ